MKSLIKNIGVLFLASCITASCSKDALRTYDGQQQLNAVENVNDPFLLSSIIKDASLFYSVRGYDDSRLPGAVQYMVRNYQGGDNYYQGFKSPVDDMYAAMNVLKLVDGAIGLAEQR